MTQHISVEAPVPSLAQCSRLRIQHCWSCGIGHCCGSDLISGLGTSYTVGDQKRKKKKTSQDCFLFLLACLVSTLLKARRGLSGIRIGWQGRGAKEAFSVRFYVTLARSLAMYNICCGSRCQDLPILLVFLLYLLCCSWASRRTPPQTEFVCCSFFGYNPVIISEPC